MLRTDRTPAMGWLLGAVLLAGLTPALAQDGRLTGLKLSGKDPIQIESDRLEVRDAEKVAVFSGNVTVVQGDTLMKAGQMTVYYAGEGGSATTGSADIERLEIDHKIYVKSGTQEATGDKGIFDMKSEILTLTGERVVLTEGSNILVGCRLTVDMSTGEAQVQGCANGGSAGSGRVIMSITPGSVPAQSQ
ncbi:MAG: LPS ABC transporter substrate-binding protein LptA [Rhizobiaceae bacterium]|nr:LPS ABC transporter substrate-binding protein LptA [Rhizobiaceae bacterium]